MTHDNLNPRDENFSSSLEQLAESIRPNPAFQSALEEKLKAAHRPRRGFALPSFRSLWPALGGALALAALAFALNWGIRNLAPLPPQPAAGNTPAPALTPTPDAGSESSGPAGEKYDHFGTTIYLQAELPSIPAEAAIYNYQREQHASLEDARALAAQFGMGGAVYRTRSQIATPDMDHLIVDGNQWLHVRSDQYFQYYPDYPRYMAAVNGGKPPADAEALIENFLQTHGFDFPHNILPSNIYGGFVAAPLTPDGRVICYEYFACAGLNFQLDEQGILYVDGILPKYDLIGQYGIISADEAFQEFLNAKGTAGIMEGMISPSAPIQTWLRARPLDQTLILYGYLASVPSAEGGAPLVTLDGVAVTGDTSNVPPEYGNTFVEATGQFHEQNGAKTFALEKWAIYSNGEDGLLGAISLQNGQVILNTMDDEIFILPDASDLPLPLDNAFVIGVREGGTFQWKSIDLRNIQGGGGGGGGGFGFYKLNLTGAPVPFSTPLPQSMGGGGGGGDGGDDGVSTVEVTVYQVQANDTCRSIADAFSISEDELRALNNLPADCSTLYIGQQITLPAASAQKVEGLRGYLSITIYKQKDGSQRVEYGFINDNNSFSYLLLEGENLEPLQAYQNRPVDIWGTIETHDNGQYFLKVDRYEIPFPDLKFQILHGTQTPIVLDGQPVTLFTTDDGKTYAQLNPSGGADGSTVGNLDDEILIEALIVPDETFGSYPALRIFSAATATNPKNGEAQEMQISADQVYIVDEAAEGEQAPPSMIIERVELVYYMPDPRYLAGELEPDQKYLQPAWLFAGHYSTGESFFILVQALNQEFLLPEPAPHTQPG
ncbi:MAG: hypothetical protein HFACDABA_01210 [Anaerolineales bacterium]|nr:hypothetical protein [Anaerolineales bacterium]